jgi:hypothetical protein
MKPLTIHLIAFFVTVATGAVVGGLGYLGTTIYARQTGGWLGTPMNLVLVPVLVAGAVAAVTAFIVMPFALGFAALRERKKMRAFVPPALFTLLAAVVVVPVIPLFGREATDTESLIRLLALGMIVAVPSFLVYWFALGALQQRFGHKNAE